MKILAPATANPFKKTCKRCLCVFVYDNSDVKHYVDFPGSDKNHSYVSCPECKFQVPANRISHDNPEFYKDLDI